MPERIKISVDHRSEANLRKLARALIGLATRAQSEASRAKEVIAKDEEHGAAA